MEKYGNFIGELKAKYDDYEKKVNSLEDKASIKDAVHN